jgi:signal transduction histidine kinase
MNWLIQKRVRSSLYLFLPVFFASFVFALGLTVLAAMELLLPLSDAPVDRVTLATFYSYVKTATVVIVLLAAGSGLVVAYALNRPLKRLDSALKGLREGRIEEVAIEGTNEFVSLSRSLNETMVSVRRDLEEKRHFAASREVERLERLASLGALAAGVAHEIRNPLGSIKGLAQLIAEGVEKGSDGERYSKVIISEIDNANEVVENLLDLSRSHVNKVEEFDLHRLLRESVDSVVTASSVEAGIEIVESEPGLSISGDYGRLRRALVNIITNAVEASPAEKSVRVEARHDGEHGLVTVDILNYGATLRNGEVEHIFEPFYTKKATGTGVGLAIAHAIISSHSGRIAVESGSGMTTFKVELPQKIEESGRKVAQ